MTSTFFLTRAALLKMLGFIYCTAFIVALNQNRALIGTSGLLPFNSYLTRLETNFVDPWERFLKVPTILWWLPRKDVSLDGIATAGLGLSSLLVLGWANNSAVLFVLWVLYHSLVQVGQIFYGYGWESQLLETGFLAIFLCPIFSSNIFSPKSPPPKPVLWLYRWLLFRIMIGAGLIKIRADPCWRDLTCLYYHFETQPNPNPIAWLLHAQPSWCLSLGVLANHFVELVAPILMLVPIRRVMLAGGLIQIIFQISIIISGNLSFLNWLTILPAIACFDDEFLSRFFKRKTVKIVEAALQEEKTKKSVSRSPGVSGSLRTIVNTLLLLTVGWLSKGPVMNMLSEKQVMNSSFDSFRLVNTYGAFGHIGKERIELVLSGTYDSLPTKSNPTEPIWLEYVFKCQPGPLNRAPCLISPYHYRLDWQLWFMGFPPHNLGSSRHSWIVHFVAKLLSGDDQILALTDTRNSDIFSAGPPRYVKGELYRYHFTSPVGWVSNSDPFNTRQTAVRDLVVLWLELQVAGGVESVREQILANKWAKNDIHVMRLYKWIIKLGARLEPSKYVNPHQAVENLANFFTK
eukprot:790800_1